MTLTTGSYRMISKETYDGLLEGLDQMAEQLEDAANSARHYASLIRESESICVKMEEGVTK